MSLQRRCQTVTHKKLYSVVLQILWMPPCCSTGAALASEQLIPPLAYSCVFLLFHSLSYLHFFRDEFSTYRKYAFTCHGIPDFYKGKQILLKPRLNWNWCVWGIRTSVLNTIISYTRATIKMSNTYIIGKLLVADLPEVWNIAQKTVKILSTYF